MWRFRWFRRAIFASARPAPSCAPRISGPIPDERHGRDAYGNAGPAAARYKPDRSCGARTWRTRNRLALGRRQHDAVELGRGRQGCPPLRRRHDAAGDDEGRPHRDARDEPWPSSGELVRDRRHGRGAAHGEFHGCSTNSLSISSTTPRTAFSSSTRPFCRSSNGCAISFPPSSILCCSMRRRATAICPTRI